MLLALYLFKDLLEVGPTKFGDVFYLGSAPSIERDNELFDVLVAVRGAVELRLLTDVETTQLHGLELHVDSKEDPGEIYFSYDEQQAPQKMQVRHGDEVYGIFQIERFIRDFVN